MAVPKKHTNEIIYVHVHCVWQCASKTEHRKTAQVTPSLHLSLSVFKLLNAVPSKHIAELRRMSRLKKKRCRDGVTCVVLLCSVLLAHCHTF